MWRQLTWLIFACCFGAVTAIRASDSPASPTFGEWRGFKRGTYLITKESNFRPTAATTGPKFNKTVLVGVSPSGSAGYSIYAADNAEGPWVSSIPSVGDVAEAIGATSFEREVGGDTTLSISGKDFICTEVKTIITTDWGTRTRIELIDQTTRAVLQKEETYVGQDQSGRPEYWDISLTTAGTNLMNVNGNDITCFTQAMKQHLRSGSLRWENVTSTAVPGSFIKMRHFGPNDALLHETELVSWGYDPDWEANYREIRKRNQISTDEETAERRRLEALENQRQLAEYRQTTTAKLVSLKADERLDAVNSVAVWNVDPDLSAVVNAALLRALDDSSIAVRRRAAVGIGQRGIRGHSAKIIALLNTDPEGTDYYLGALGSQADETGLATILQYVSGDNPFWRKAALAAMANYPDELRRAVLEKAMQDPEWEVRLRAIELLEKIADERSALVIRQALHDPNTLVAGAAATAAMKLGDRGSISGLLQLAQARREQTFGREYAALGRIATAEDQEVVGFLLQTIEGQIYPSAMVGAIGALGELRADAAVPKLKELLGARHPPGSITWVAAAAALGRIGSASAIQAVEVHLGTDRHEMICMALGRGGSMGAGIVLKHFLLSKNRVHRDADLKALSTIGSEETAAALQEYLPKCPPPEKSAVRLAISTIRKRLQTESVGKTDS